MKIIKKNNILYIKEFEKAAYNKDTWKRILTFIQNNQKNDKYIYYLDKYLDSCQDYLFKKNNFIKVNNLKNLNWFMNFNKGELIIYE